MRRFVYVAAAVMALSEVGCDSELDTCAFGAPPGASRDVCLASTFQVDTPRYLEIAGVVRRGENGVPGAVLRVAPFVRGAGPTPSARVVANPAGEFGPIPFVPFRYELWARLDRDVVAVRDLGYRYFEPTLETETATFDRAWSIPVQVTLSRPLAPQRTVTFFVSGERTYSVSGSLEQGLVVRARDFSAAFTLHAIEHEAGADLATATAYARVDGHGSANGRALVTMDLAPLDPKLTGEVTLQPVVPAGFRPGPVAIEVAYSATSRGPLTTVLPGVSKRVPFLPFVFTISYRATATADDGATLVGALTAFSPLAEKNEVVLLAGTHTVISPASGAVLSPSDPLVVSGSDVLEHVLDGEGRTIRILGRGGETTVPELEQLGLPAPKGEYVWRVRSYPKASFVESLNGPNGRTFQPVAISAPRRLTFR